MSNSKTPDELPKKRLGRSVIAEKRLYFVPDAGRSVEAATAEEAGEVALSEVSKEDEQDA